MDWLKKSHPRNSLRAQISLASALLAFLLSLALSFFAAENSKLEIEKSEGESFARRARAVLDVTDRGMFERSREIQNAVILDEIRDPKVSVARKREMLERLQNTFNAYAWIGICDANGIGAVGTGKYLEGKDLSKRPWCTKGRDNYFIGDVHDAVLLSKLLPNPSGEQFYLLDVAAPVIDQNGVLQGVLCGHIFWNWIEEALDSKRSPGKDLFLLSQAGLLLSGPETLRSDFANIAPLTMQAIKQGDASNGYLLERWANGKTYLVGWAKSSGYRDYAGLGWVAVMREDVTQAFAPAMRLRAQIVWMGFGLALFFAGLGWVLAGRIARPIVKIGTAAGKIAQGDFNYPLPSVQGEGEVAQLVGAIAHMVQHLTREIEQRRKAEEGLRLSAKVFENNSEAIMITDAEHRIVSINPAFSKITGYSRDEVLGKNPRFLNAGRQDAAFYAAFYQSLAQHDSWRGELWNKRKNGEIFPEWATISVLRNEQQQVTHYVAVYLDLTERKQSEALLSAAVEAAPNGMIIVDGRGLIIMANSQISVLFGYTTEELLGQSISCLLPQELHHAHNAHIEGYVANPSKRLMGEGRELFGLHKNGDKIQIEIGLSPLQIHGENLVLASVVNITERKKHLAQLQATTQELEYANRLVEAERAQLVMRVEERTAQLQHANHAKDSFLATMSHEIRTPLGGLLGMIELLTLSKLNSEQRQLLDAAQRSGVNLLRIVNDILDWSKIEAGKLQLAVRPGSVNDLLRSVAGTYAQVASQKNIQLKVECDLTLSSAHLFDSLRLSQILNNFVSNALKFTEHGHVTLTAKLLRQHDGSETLRLSVQDSGIGIAPEQQPRLFQNYEQGSAETARMYGGTGLGLAICHRLADLMNATLSVISTAGVGSTFSLTIDLPVADAMAQSQFKLAQEYEPPVIHNQLAEIKPLASDGEDIRILVVDDHPLNRMLLKQQLKMLGVQVELAVDGVDGLKRYQAQPFDLIITDCHMPEMDGYELTFHIRELERAAAQRSIPIIAWTANVLIEEEAHCRSAGMDDLLTKPTELADLRAMLLRWLTRSGAITECV